MKSSISRFQLHPVDFFELSVGPSDDHRPMRQSLSPGRSRSSRCPAWRLLAPRDQVGAERRSRARLGRRGSDRLPASPPFALPRDPAGEGAAQDGAERAGARAAVVLLFALHMASHARERVLDQRAPAEHALADSNEAEVDAKLLQHSNVESDVAVTF